MSGYTKKEQEELDKYREEKRKRLGEIRLLEKKYKEKWHPKKPNRPRGLKKGEWKG